ncbi:MAG: indolepyruvate oxidoreductase subunit beta [Desulfobacteraceae bacterium]|nr:indolepyruvate oxidoreductase subunit beta [Desulfobacteraceae bacterium]
MTKNILIVGVGGQGTILAGDILSKALIRAGFDVKKSEIHGMAQRGGSVTSHVRYGEKVSSPVIGEGEADILVAFERLEALRYIHFLKEGGQVLVNDLKIPPPSVASKQEAYTDKVEEIGKKRNLNVKVISGTGIGEKVGDVRTTNLALLGALSTLMEVPEEIWMESIQERFPEKLAELNQKAFKAGRDTASGMQ